MTLAVVGRLHLLTEQDTKHGIDLSLLAMILPVANFILLVYLFTRRSNIGALIEGLIRAYLVFVSYIVVSTEILSTFDAINYSGILGAWLLFFLGCLVASIIVGQRHGRLSLPDRLPTTKLLPAFFVASIGTIVVATFVTAILYPPTTWDSMTYHMARVANWANNQSISFYPTHIMRQLWQMPLAEYGILHLQILSGSDLFANLVQWMAFCVSICLGALIAAELSLPKISQLASGFVIATIPMAILQSTSTQNDVVLSSFILSLALFMLKLEKDFRYEYVFFAALSLGLSLLTKGTGYIFVAAIVLGLGIPILFKLKRESDAIRRILGSVSLVLFFTLVLNIGHLSRNYQTYGHPLSTEGGVTLNQEFSASAFLGNSIRNVTLHLGVHSSRINWYMYRAVSLVLGDQAENPNTTFSGTSYTIRYSQHEDTAGNLVHFVILLFSIPMGFYWLRSSNSQVTWYLITIVLGVFIYLLFLKWQPWASRLHLPLFMLASPIIVIFLRSLANKRTSYAIFIAMLILSFPFVVNNISRSLMSSDWYKKGREALYFQSRPQLYDDYKGAIDVLKDAKAKDVGLYIGTDDWEYPFWVLANTDNENIGSITFRHVAVSNISANLQTNMTRPSFIITTKPTQDLIDIELYSLEYTSDHVSVFRDNNK